MNITAFSVWLAITSAGVDVGGGVMIETPAAHHLARAIPGMTNAVTVVPHVVISRPWATRGVWEHEARHLGHFDALGPVFPLAYVLTAGRPFEDYQGSMWEPPPGLERQCPVVRYDFDAREMTFMPCWQGVLEWR